MQKCGCVWTKNLDSFAISRQVLEQLNWNDDGAENLPILGKLIAHDALKIFLISMENQELCRVQAYSQKTFGQQMIKSQL